MLLYSIYYHFKMSLKLNLNMRQFFIINIRYISYPKELKEVTLHSLLTVIENTTISYT